MHPEHAEALPLEQHCVAPGWWKIEGFLVRKKGRKWYVREGWDGGDLVRVEETLARCREWIRRQ